MTLQPAKIFTFFDQLEEYKKGNSHHFFLFLRENRTLISILNDNYRDLKCLIDYHNSPELEAKFWNRDPTFRFRLQKKIIRLLSNYLSSFFVVRDYSRNSIKNYLEQNDSIYKIYDDYIKANFAENPVHRFIQNLRNYTSHITYIKIGSEISYNIEWTEPKKTIFILKSEILKWEKWDTFSKSFISSQDEKIQLFDIIQKHHSDFVHFQNFTYMLILLTNPQKTEEYIHDVNDIFNKSVDAGISHQLMFKEHYIRYINCVYKKALRTTK